MRRWFGTVLVVVALVMHATPAGAQQVPHERIDVSAFTLPFDDGGSCTGVPDTIPGIFDFTTACAGHDLCYAGGQQTQAQCDDRFLQDMSALCLAQHPGTLNPVRLVCLTFAHLYYAGVSLFGRFFI
ncbi:MAG TPA: phospholipase A2 [Acidimicrobiales bacterium]|nr:phospholipase A2 [Acidimicrobiales bacterium]